MKIIFPLKSLTGLLIPLFIFSFSNSFSLPSWLEKNGVGWNQPASQVPMARDGFTGFSTSGSVYFGTGYNETILFNYEGYGDLYQYDPATNLWSPRNTFSPRDNGCGFAIGTKGYIGFGYYDSNKLNDFWEYDPSSGSWNQKADFPDTVRTVNFSFGVNSKGYIGGGSVNDLWEFDPSLNTWTLIDTLPFDGDLGNAAFAITTNAYVVGNNLNWKFDSQLLSWSIVSPFPSTGPYTAFELQGNGYVICNNNNMFAYDPLADQWTQKANLLSIYGGLAGSDGTYGYYFSAGPVIRYDASLNIWTEQKSSPNEFNLTYYSGKLITLNNHVYSPVSVYDPVADLWIHDTTTYCDQWLFAINNTGYAIRGNSFEKYDPLSATWTPLNAPGFDIGITFEANGKGYSVLGRDSLGNLHTDLHEYDPVSDIWTLKSPYPGQQREYTRAFSISEKGYLVCGVDLSFSETPEFWQYDPTADLWIQKADYPGSQFYYMAFTEQYHGMGYVGLGRIETSISDDKIYRYDPFIDSWSQVVHPLGIRGGAISFVANDSLYVGRGFARQNSKFSYRYNDLWAMGDTLTTSDSELNPSKLSVLLFPNPSSHYIRITGVENSLVEVFNQNGQTIFFHNYEENTFRLDVSEFPAGIYFLKVTLLSGKFK